jgi:hypothetical protein
MSDVKNKYNEIIQKALDENERDKNLLYFIGKRIKKFFCSCRKAKKGFQKAEEEKKKED